MVVTPETVKQMSRLQAKKLENAQVKLFNALAM
jgi:hypothetical protein